FCTNFPITLHYIPSYTKNTAKRIYPFKLNHQTPLIQPLQTPYQIQPSTYLTPNQSFLYPITKQAQQCALPS
ncbi:beta-propeller fold lactonase family protein, partial [Staphylococcus epidermidis]|uniref:beta-propeller fold lactonase family protein n=1 Tax=Staphylococcus epidermidis TaxID=1282 RepID=UPI0011A30453